MINYKPATYRELKGDFKAKVYEVEVEPNNYYKPEEDNSTESVLNITFLIEDPQTLEESPFVQKYIAPLTEGRSLFQQLIDCTEFLPDNEGGEFDEQSLAGLELVATFGKNKKGYDSIIAITPIKATKKMVAPKAKNLNAEAVDNLPF